MAILSEFLPKRARRRQSACLQLALLAALVFPAPAFGQDDGRIAGRASAVDGATLDVAGVRVRLFGIAAPAVGQHCPLRSGQTWPCGQNAAFALANIVGRHWVHCRPVEKETGGTGADPAAAVCTLAGADGPEVNAAMVRQGWARAAPDIDTYRSLEATARQERLGLWADSSAQR